MTLPPIGQVPKSARDKVIRPHQPRRGWDKKGGGGRDTQRTQIEGGVTNKITVNVED